FESWRASVGPNGNVTVVQVARPADASTRSSNVRVGTSSAPESGFLGGRLPAEPNTRFHQPATLSEGGRCLREAKSRAHCSTLARRSAGRPDNFRGEQCGGDGGIRTHVRVLP